MSKSEKRLITITRADEPNSLSFHLANDDPNLFNALRRTLLGFVPHKSLDLHRVIDHNKLTEFYIKQIIRNIPIKHRAVVGEIYKVNVSNPSRIKSKHIYTRDTKIADVAVRKDIFLFTLNAQEFEDVEVIVVEGIPHDNVMFSACNTVKFKKVREGYDITIQNNGEVDLTSLLRNAVEVLYETIDNILETAEKKESSDIFSETVPDIPRDKGMRAFVLTFTLADKYSVPLLIYNALPKSSVSHIRYGHPLENKTTIMTELAGREVYIESMKLVRKKIGKLKEISSAK